MALGPTPLKSERNGNVYEPGSTIRPLAAGIAYLIGSVGAPKALCDSSTTIVGARDSATAPPGITATIANVRRTGLNMRAPVGGTCEIVADRRKACWHGSGSQHDVTVVHAQTDTHAAPPLQRAAHELVER